MADSRWLINRPRLSTLALLAALMLSACGALPSSGALGPIIQDHTVCASARYAAPQWSGDGALIYYSSLVVSGLDLRVMTRLGRDDRQLAPDVVGPLVSPDGASILYLRTLTPGVLAYRYYDLDPLTRQARQLGLPGEQAAWSPDSRWIAFVSTAQLSGSLFKHELSTGRNVLLDRVPDGVSGWDAYPVWSSDGQELAFAAVRDGRPSIQVISADGGVSNRLLGGQPPACLLPSPVEQFWPLGWLPDGRALLIQDLCDRRAALHLVDRTGRPAADLGALGPDASQAQLSPDGGQIVYVLDDPHMQHPGLSIARSDGSGVRVLQANAQDARWSPDGQLIAFVGHDAAGLDEVFTVRPDGSGLAQLTDNPGNGRVCLH